MDCNDNTHYRKGNPMRLFLYRAYTLATLGAGVAVVSFVAGATTHAWAQGVLADKKDDETLTS